MSSPSNSNSLAVSAIFMAVLSLETMVPALAQSTVLTGKVATSSSMPALIKQNPVYDTITVMPSTTDTATYGGSAQAGGPGQSQFQANPQFTKQLPAAARQAGPQTVYVQRPVYRTVYLRDNRTFFQRHPKVKAASIGAGIGAGAGALTGLISGRGVLRGAAIGAGTGAGVGLVRSSVIMKRHPIVRDLATGSLTGLGLAASASRRGVRAWQGAGVGAALGLGYGLFKHGLK
jgi:hypothetical protein